MALQFVTSQIKNLAITNDKLAGSIADSKLLQITEANKVAGSALQLAGSGGLENSSGIKISDGGVTDDMLAGSISNAKLTNASVTVAGNEIALGSSLAAATLAGSMSLSDIAAPTGAVAMANKQITGLADPSVGTDAANKQYVDSVAQGLDLKESVKVATTAAITLSGTQSIDGVAVAADDRVLVKDQGSAVDNGIYLCKAGAWQRATDFASGDDEAGAFCFVEQGTVNGDNGFVVTSDKGSAQVGTDSIVFTQFSGAGQIVAGDGLAKSGNTLSVEVDDSSIEISSDALRVKAAGITDAMLAGSISNGKLANSTVSFGGVSLALGASDATPAFDLADATNYPTSSLVGTITNAQLAGSIENGKLQNSTISGKALGANLDNLSAGNGLTGGSYNGSGTASFAVQADGGTITVGGSGIKISDDGVQSINIANGAVQNSKIQDAAVTLAKLGLTGKFETTTISDSSTVSIGLASRIADADFRHGAFVQVFRNGQRLEYKASGKANNTQYDIADDGSATSVGFGAALEDGDVIFISYMI